MEAVISLHHYCYTVIALLHNHLLPSIYDDVQRHIRSYVSSKQKIDLPIDFVLKFEPKHVMKNLIPKGNSARGFIYKNKNLQDAKEYNQQSPKGRGRNFLERRMGGYNQEIRGKATLIKAKSFDEKHQFTSNASAKAVAVDLDPEQKAQTVTTAIMINPYMSSGVVWVSSAFAAITKAVEVFHMDVFG
ncbi:hypothetical protein L2E82_24574 [Cichorium intybus]|uniref:Uncharacterized protein n=1 Tax=Cichorium intybus TaxID=13427 RepID=A0ACB9E1E0_CICIN|nr:hypothetical protein L2E82_24574 [Cichorium intybus]